MDSWHSYLNHGMESFNSYPSIYALGHKALQGLLDVPVLVEEKVDGSQFSFGVTEDGLEVKVRSKGANLYVEAPEKMFKQAVATVLDIEKALTPGWTYRAEYLSKPKHNALVYNRVPEKHLIIFDINDGHESYLGPEAKAEEAQKVGLECVPMLYQGTELTLDVIRELLDTESVLGGQKIEGVVVKPLEYNLFGQDKKVLMGKFVSEAFKEVHAGSWKEGNPGQKDIIQRIGMRYQTQARWQKALMHLKESGVIEGNLKDIGHMMREVPEDILKEHKEEMMEELWQWAWPSIRRITVAGLPEYYKEELLKLQFDNVPD